MIYIVGIGPGHIDYILKKAENIIKNSDYVIGFSRSIDTLESMIKGKKIKVNNLKEILTYMENLEGDISILASGDPLFYGIADYISKNFNRNFEVIPGISSFQYLTAKTKRVWNKTFLGSMHGREEKFLEHVKNNCKTIWLTDNKNTPKSLCEILIKNNINCTIIVGENLSYENERIVEGNPREILNYEFSNLSVMMVEVK
ncbi:Probable cobalt-precorrin-6Y C(5)-methyltransferase [Sarcina ventriculi]|uniref:precorrin-6y C5,15-methyltransferase (decarboxylating) subunit CbiE n=1 Tax=Sarcina ventriculi TaxID=1267 RepID=UPI000D96C917|nr:precorrin-6y C5,15-methyltransferase (decarboxylating) subunit CbiE [Sarcina ventriculi]SPZ51121.1 Probable cobalt-precorrin-6Y C(5)-methyltransferase [Sarcina ventriculi]